MTTESAPGLPSALAALRPRRAYVVCATPRSGSTLLCELLEGTGVAGRPAEHVESLGSRGRPMEPREYFAEVSDPSVLEALPASSPPRPVRETSEQRLAGLLAGATTPNGTFGTKVMWVYLGDLQERLAELPGFAALGEAERLTALLGDVRYVHVSRTDRIAQAVSMWRAVQTRAWRAETSEAVEPVYSFAGIAHLVRQLETNERAWRRWFEREGVTPLEVGYDELAADPDATLRRTLAFVGVGDEFEGDAPIPSVRRQSGQQSREWAERYRREEEAHR
jgi:trehalose 2-sulfotransferase